MRQHCGQCRQPFALAFDRCPACGTPAGSNGVVKKVASASKPAVPATESVAEPAQISAIPDLDLSGLESRHASLELAPTEPEPPEELPSAPAAPSGGAASWEAAAMAARAPPPPATPLMSLPLQEPARSSESTAVTFARIVTWIGAACLVLGLLPIGSWRLFFSFDKVEVKDLPSLRAGKRIELVDGVADWNNASVVDQSEAIELSDTEDLQRRATLLRGKLVSLSAMPLGGYMYKQYRIGPNGQREEIPGVTRVFMPLTIDNSVWAVSGLVQASSFDDPAVKEHLTSVKHSGLLRELREHVDLDDIRNPQNSGGTVTTVPDDALAIVVTERGTQTKKYTVANVAGTEGRYVAVTTGKKPAADESLFGEHHPCPSAACETYAALLPVTPQGVLVLSDAKAFPWKAEVAMFMLLGVAFAAGGVMFRRRLESS